MFCSNCGKPVEEGANFCKECGTPVAGQENNNVVTVIKIENPIMADSLKRIKGFFSANTVKTVGEAAKSTGLEWLFFAAISILAYALAFASNLGRFITAFIGSFARGYYNFGAGLFIGILIGALTFFLMGVLMFLTVRVIYKQPVSIMSAFNMVAVASIPLTCVYIINIIVGFIWFPLVIMLSLIGLVATVVLLYAGMQRLAEFEASPFLAYICIWSVCIAVVSIILGIIVSISTGIAAASASILPTLPNIY